MKKLWEYVRPYLPRMGCGFAIKFTGAIMDLLIPWMLSTIIDTVIPTGDMGRVLIWGGLMILASGAVYAFNVIPNRMAAHVARDITEEVRRDLYNKTSSLSCAQVDRLTIPSLISRITSDSYNIHRMLNMIQRLGVRAQILLVGGLIVTMAMEPRLGAVLLLLMPLMGLLVLVATAIVAFASVAGGMVMLDAAKNIETCATNSAQILAEMQKQNRTR